MKIDIISDIHVDSYVPYNDELEIIKFIEEICEGKNADVLVIAGDISEYSEQVLWVLEAFSEEYEKVFFTYGNHDMYVKTGYIEDKGYKYSEDKIEDILNKTLEIENVVPLFKSTYTYKGKVFAGDILYAMPRNKKDELFYKEMYQDSKYIKLKDHYGAYNTSEELYKQSLKWLGSLGDKEIDVMITHIPPTYNKLSQHPPNTCYYVEVNTKNVKHWIFGHDHTRGRFEKNGTMFYTNSFGYPNEMFNPISYNVMGQLSTIVI